MSIAIALARVDRTYRAGEEVEGVVKLNLPGSTAHAGLILTARGTVSPQTTGRGASVLSARGASIRPVTILFDEIEMESEGSLPGGELELPFRFGVDPVDGEELVETYHGVYVSVVYSIHVVLKRTGLFTSHLEKEVTFAVHVPSKGEVEPTPVDVRVTPETLRNIKGAASLPPFEVVGRIHQTKCSLSRPLTGEIEIKSSETPIRSVDVQLVRVETIRTGDGGSAREASEIMDLQIGEGDVPRKMPLPLFLVLPRLFTCPTARSPAFSVEFELNLIVAFEGDFQISEPIKLELFR